MRVVKRRSRTPRQRQRPISSLLSSVKVIMPSTSDGAMPASSSAAFAHSAASWSSLRPESFENSVWPMPAIAVGRTLRLAMAAASGLATPRPEDGDRLPAARRLEVDLDGQALADLARRGADDVRHDPDPLLELDERDDRRLGEAHGRRVARDDPAVDGAAPREAHLPSLDAVAARAHRTRRMPQLAAGRAGLREELAAQRPLPEERAVARD